MALRIIKCIATEEYLVPESDFAGAAGSFNDVALRITFSQFWDGLLKEIVWVNALGANPVVTLITEAMRVEERTYDVLIPASPKQYAGRMTASIRGYSVEGETETRSSVSVSHEFDVGESVYEAASPVEDIDAPLYEQLRSEIPEGKTIIGSQIGLEDGPRKSVGFVPTYWKNDVPIVTVPTPDGNKRAWKFELCDGDGNAPTNMANEPVVGDWVSCRCPYSANFLGKVISKELLPDGTPVRIYVGLEDSMLKEESLPYNFVPAEHKYNAEEAGYMWFPYKPSVGAGPDVKGQGAAAVGLDNTANEQGAFVCGEENIADGRYSFVSGYRNTAGYNAFVSGRENEAKGISSAAIGFECKANNYYSQAFGHGNETGRVGANFRGIWNNLDPSGTLMDAVGYGSEENRQTIYGLTYTGKGLFKDRPMYGGTFSDNAPPSGFKSWYYHRVTIDDNNGFAAQISVLYPTAEALNAIKLQSLLNQATRAITEPIGIVSNVINGGKANSERIIGILRVNTTSIWFLYTSVTSYNPQVYEVKWANATITDSIQ